MLRHPPRSTLTDTLLPYPTPSRSCGCPGSLGPLGTRVVAGRAPQAADYQPGANFVPANASVLVTRALAEHLWPGADPLGREIWLGDDLHFRVIGVLDHM